MRGREATERHPLLRGRPGIRARFALIFVLLVVLPTAAFIIWFTQSYYTYALHSVIENKVSLLNQSEKGISARMANYRNTTLMFYYNDAIMRYINRGGFGESPEAVGAYLSSFVNTERDVINVTLRLDGARPQYAGSTLLLPEDYYDTCTPRVMAAKGRPVLLPTQRISTNYVPRIYAFALARAINDPEEPVGSLWVFIRASFFDDMLGEAGLVSEDTVAYVLAGDQVVASSDAARTGTTLDNSWVDRAAQLRDGYFETKEEGQDLVVAVAAIGQTDWHIVSVTGRRAILESIRYIPLMAVLVFGLYAVFVATMYLMLSRMMFKPITRLSRGLRKVGKGDFAYVIPRTTDDEIGELTDNYNVMTGRIQSLMDDVRRQEQEKNNETIKVLSMQIGSHFLYNTLNTIRWMAVLNKQPKIRDMVVSLTKLLMSVTYHSGGEIALRDELTLVRHYAVIQKARFANFEIEYDVPERLMDLAVSKMILQPVIENSIVHGFGSRAEQGAITISATRQGDTLLLTVSDNGSGFDPSLIDWDASDDERADHVGLRNIHQRLRLNYGEEAGLSVESSPGHGTVVTLRMPAFPAPPAEAPQEEGEA